MKTPLLAGLGVLLAGTLVLAGAAPEHVLSDQALLKNWQRDVYVVKVKAVDDKGATNSKPPRVVVVIKEALRGEFKPGAEIEAIWHPFPHDIDTSGRAKELQAWNNKPLKGPKVGEELIILEYQPWEKKPFSVSPRCRFALTKEKRDSVASLMGDWKKLRKEAADQEAAAKKAEEEALEGDRRLQARADLAKLCRQATDIAEGTSYACHKDVKNGGWFLEVKKTRSIKRPDVRLDEDKTGDIYVWTDQDLSKIMPVRGSRNKVLLFLGPLPKKFYRNAHQLIGGDLGVLEATPERLAELRAILTPKEKGKK